MKRVIMNSFLLITLSILLVGCGSKKVVCENKSVSDNADQTMTITGTFKNNKISKLVENQVLKLSGEYAKDDSFYSAFEKQYKETADTGITVDVSRKDNTITVKRVFEINKINAENSSILVEKGASPKDMIEAYEKNGYSCK